MSRFQEPGFPDADLRRMSTMMNQSAGDAGHSGEFKAISSTVALKNGMRNLAILMLPVISIAAVHAEDPEELRAVFPSLDNFKYNDRWWVLDVGGNNLRVLAFIQFVNGRIFIKHIVSHADYDKLTTKYRKASNKKR